MPYPFSPPTVNYGLANQANAFMQQQARLPYAFNLPNYGGMLAQRSKNISGLLAGQVPQDVVQQIQQRGAERGVATGMPGGPNMNTAWLRALGLTSLGLQQQGSQQFSQAIQDTPVSPLFNPLAAYIPQLQAYQEFLAAQQGQQGNGGVVSYGPAYSAGPSSYQKPFDSSGLAFNKNYNAGGGVYGALGPFEQSPTPTDPNMLAQQWWKTYGVTPSTQDAFTGEGSGSA